MRTLVIVAALTTLLSSTLQARTLILEGELESTILLTQQIGFTVDKQVDILTFRFALPTRFSNRGVTQDVNKLSFKVDPQPAAVESETDSFGNNFKKVTWKRLKSDVSINLKFETSIKSELSAMTSKSLFPLKSNSPKEVLFLKSTDLVQSGEQDIVELSRTLTSGAATEYQAVSSILNFVADNIKYTYNPDKYDAHYTLVNRSGNCQNFAHLSMALLRAAGIPARIVGGISLKEQWKVPIDAHRSVVQGMGQGGHAWMEIYFPDLGWLSYDPQQSRQFTSSRHIKQTHGLDSKDINDTWSAAPYLPKYSENIEAKFIDDRIDVRFKGSDTEPRPYLVSNAVKLAFADNVKPQPQKPTLPEPAASPAPALIQPSTMPPVVITPPPAAMTLPKPEAIKKPPLPPEKPAPKPERIKPPTPPKKPQPQSTKKPDPAGSIEFGNMEFPSFVDSYRVTGMSGTRILDKETSEYVTSKNIYAQALLIDNDLYLDRVSVAMHKFGGDGSVFLDFVADDNGKPSLVGLRSRPVFLDKVSKRPGYWWLDFNYNEEESRPLIRKGKYWIVLRHSGDAIMTWFYIPGKPYSGGDDTRSTAKGFMWEDILNYDFVFKVTGKVLAAKAQ